MAFNLFKRNSGKKIKLDAGASNDFVVPVKLKGNEIIIDSKLNVPDGYVAVIVCKDKPTDVFIAGDYELSLGLMPKTTKAMGLAKGKVKRKGKSASVILPKKFKGDIYYVKLSPFTEQEWHTVGGVEVKSKTYGRFSYKASGKFDFQVANAQKAIKLFLIDWAYIKPGKALEKLGYYFGDSITRQLMVNKINEPVGLLDKELMTSGLLSKVSVDFAGYGIQIMGMDFKGVSLPKDISERIGMVEQSEKESDAAQTSPDSEYVAPEYVPYEDKSNMAQNESSMRERIPFYDAVMGSGEKSEYSRQLNSKTDNQEAEEEPQRMSSDQFSQELERIQKDFDKNLGAESGANDKPRLIVEQEELFTQQAPSEQEWQQPVEEQQIDASDKNDVTFDEPIDIQSLIDKPSKHMGTHNRRRGLPLCKNCNEILQVGEKVCSVCGTDNACCGKKVCSVCGAENDADAQFCGCGCFLP